MWLVCLGLEPPGRPSVFLITKTTSRNGVGCRWERIKGAGLCGCFLLRGFGGYSERPYMCSGSRSCHDLLQMVERKKKKEPANQHTH